MSTRRRNPSTGPLDDARLPDEGGAMDRIHGFGAGHKAARAPHRSRSVAQLGMRNEHGVLFTYRIESNRTRNRWFYTVLVGDGDERGFGRTRHDAASTSSPRIAAGWIAALEEAAKGLSKARRNPRRASKRRRVVRTVTTTRVVTMSNPSDISSHLHTKPFQVAMSTDRHMPLRKWNHLGTYHAVSARDAAYRANHEQGRRGDIRSEHATSTGVAFEFPGHFIHVKF